MPASAQFLVIIAALVLFWLLVMAPTRRQQKRVGQLQGELQPGDAVVISAGIFGTIRSVDGNKVTLEVAPGTVVTVARQVVVRRQEPDGAVDGGADVDGGPASEQAPESQAPESQAPDTGVTGTTSDDQD